MAGRYDRYRPAIFRLVGLSVLAVAIIGAVYYFGDIPNRNKNGFRRTYIPGAFSGTREMDVPDTLSGIAGANGTTIYLTTPTEGEVLAIDAKLQGESKRISIPFFARWYDSLQFSSLQIRIDSPRIYLFAENKPAIIITTFDSSMFEIRILPRGSFTREVAVDTDCFILRKVEPSLVDQIFIRYDFRTGMLTKEKDISQRYGDGGIVSDGQLLIDAKTKKLYYLYYYKNLLLSFDTSLRTVTKFSSIDTTASFKVRTGSVGSGAAAAFTNITPANMINKTSYVENGILYNMSALKADNDSDVFFAANSIIDIIDLKKGNYLGSMALPVVDGHKLSRFIISNGRLIGLYTHSMVMYKLDADPARHDQ